MIFESINTLGYVDLGIGFIISILFSVFILCVTDKFKFAATFFIFCLVTDALFLFGFNLAGVIALVITIATLTLILLSYSSRIYKIFTKHNKTKVDEDDEFYSILEEAVVNLAKSKTGALITIEKDESLKDYIEKGKPVKAPVNADLIRSIFFVGTPLHDGAIIIKRKTIEAASVYFTPTTKAMPGKYGARHRAAIGFSETHSSITIVVSEETGRINFAVAGELIPVSQDSFKKRLQEYLEN